MTDQIFFDGKKYISAHDAAESSSVTRDYIARLCRDGKVRGRRIGKNWYVEEGSLKHFLVEQEYQKSLRKENLAKQREEEYKKSNPEYVKHAPVQRVAAAAVAAAAPISPIIHAGGRATEYSPVYAKLASAVAQQSGRALERAGDLVNTPTGFADAAIRVAHVPTYAVTPIGEFVHKLVALTLAVMLTFGTYALVDPNAGAFVATSAKESTAAVASVINSAAHGGIQRATAEASSQLAAAAANPSGTFGGIPEFFRSVARSFNDNVDAFVYAIAFPQQLTGSSGSVAISIQPYAKPQPIQQQNTSGVAVAPVTKIVQTVQQPVVTERIVQAGGISEQELNDRLNQLSNKLVSQIYGITSAPSSLPASGGYTNNIALSQRIDNLGSVDITGSSFSGGSITDSSVSATSLSVSGSTSLATTTIQGGLTVQSGSNSTTPFLVKGSNGSDIFSIADDGTLTTNVSSSTSLVSSILITGNATATELYVQSLIASISASTTNLLAYNATTTNLAARGFTSLATTTVSGDLTLSGSLRFTSSSSTISASGASFDTSSSTNLTASNATTTNLIATNATTTNFFATNASTTNATSTNFFAAAGRMFSGVIDSLSATIASITNLTSTNLIATNATTTNATTTNLAVANLTSFSAPIAPYFIATSSSATSTFAGAFEAASNFHVLQNGKVGIGTAAPQTSLDVVGNSYFRNAAGAVGSNDGVEIATDSSAPRVSLVQGGRYVGLYSGDSVGNTYLKNVAGGDLILDGGSGGNVELARLTNGGSFGIGTTSPFAKLGVAGDAYIGGNLTATGTASLASLAGAAVSNLTTNYVPKWNSVSGVFANSSIYDSGTQVGIGTNSNLSGAVTANGTFGVQAEGDIFRQYDSGDSAWYPIIARYNTNNGTYPASTYIFGNGANAKVAFEVPGGGDLATFQVRANNSTFNGNVTLSSLSANTLLYANGSSQVANASVGSSLTFSGGALSLNTGNANSFSALQQFANATSTLSQTTQKAYFGTGGQSSFDFTGALTLGTPLAQSSGGTGITNYTAGDILYADGSGNLQKLPIGGTGTVLKVQAGLPAWGSDLTSNDSGAVTSGLFSTTTDNLLIYQTDTSKVVSIGANATSSLNSIFEVHGQSYFSSNVGIATTTPQTNFAVTGSGYFTGGLGVGVLNTSAGTLQTSGNATIGGTLLLPSVTGSSLLYNNGFNQVAAAATDSSLVFSSGTLSLNTSNSNTFSALQNFGGGLTAYASSTIGNGAQNGGLTISGGATTTGNQYVAGILGVGTQPVVGVGINTNGQIRTSSTIQFGTGSALIDQTRGQINFPADGVIQFRNAALTGFSGFKLGGTSSSFPYIKVNGTGIDFRLADDSAYTNIAAANITANGRFSSTNASTSLLSVTGKAYFGGTATTTIDSAGNISLPSGAQILAADGTDSLPGIAFANNPASGISNSSGSLSLSTDGFNRLTVTTGGVVGIGTTTPSADLEVATSLNGFTANLLYLTNQGGATSTASRFAFRTLDATGGATSTGAITSILNQNYGAGKGDIVFSTLQNGALAEAMRVTSAGNLGIGTATPAGKLDVYNGISYFRGTGTGNILNIYHGTTDTVGASFTNEGSNNVNLTFSRTSTGQVATQIGTLGNTFFNAAGGNVGIGTTSPYALLSLAATPSNVSAGGALFSISSSTAAFATSTLFSVSNTGQTVVGPGGTSGTQELVVNDTGSDSTSIINLNSTTGRLQVGGLNYFSAGAGSSVFDVSTNGYIQFRQNLVETMRIASTGFLGVGTSTPWGQLSASSTSAAPALAIQQNGAGASALFLGGNVGVGTTSPSALFAVGGNTFLGGTLTTTGDVSIGANQIKGAANETIQMASATGFTLTNPNNGWGINIAADYLRLAGGGSSNYNLQFSTDGNISRLSAGKLGVGNGTQGDTSGTLIAGNIGIGTTTPGAKLSFGTSAGFDGVHLYNDGSFKSGFGITSNTLNIYSGGTSIAFGHGIAASASSMTPDMILVNGNVGIGTTTPLSKFQIVGTQFISNASGLDSHAALYADTNGFNIEAENYANSSKKNILIAPWGGNVGIGTTTPATTLGVNGGAYFSGNLNIAGQQITSDGVGASMRLTAAAGLFLNAGASTKFSVSNATTCESGSLYCFASNGNVGIGTTTPTAALQVVASGTTAPSLTWGAASGQILRNENSEFAFGLSNASPFPLWIQGRNSNNAARDISLQPLGGNIGIGTTSPASTFSVNGSGYFTAGLGVGRVHATTGEIHASSHIIADGAVWGAYAAGYGDAFVIGNDAKLVDINAGNTFAVYGLSNNAVASMQLGSGGGTISGASSNIGIGTTTPFRKLSVTDTVSAAQVAIAYDASRYTQLQVDSAGDFHVNPSGGDAQQDDSNLWICSGGSCPTGTPSGTGNLIVESKIGVGTSTPIAALQLKGGGNALPATTGTAQSAGLVARFQDSSNLVLDIGGNGSTGFWLQSTDMTGLNTNYPLLLNPNGGKVGVGTTSPAQSLSTSGMIFVGANGATGMGTATSTFYGDIKINGKLDVSTIDPVYTIDGIKYATYGDSTVGIHENVQSTVELTQDAAGDYSYTIDFDKLAKGSDLWLFYQITDFGTDWKQLVVSLTPGFAGEVHYEKIPGKNELKIVGSGAGEVSMKLSANRYDFSKWPNLRTDQDGNTEGTHVISSKDASAADTN